MTKILIPLDMDIENRQWLRGKELKRINPKTTNDKDKKDKPVSKSIFTISKAYEDKKQVFGWFLVSADWEQENGKWVLKQLVDHQQDAIDESELEKMAYTYVLKYRDSGVMHESNKKIIGKCIESMCWTIEKQIAMNIPQGLIPIGWWGGFQITDESIWNRIKNGELKDFSIEGMATREETNVDETLYKVAKRKIGKTFGSLFKFNECHEEAGQSNGGQFCSTEGSNSSSNTTNEKTSTKETSSSNDKSLTAYHPLTWIKRLSTKEVNALNSYTSESYKSINEQLRKGKVDSKNKKLIESIDTALEKSRLQEDSTLYENQKLYRAAYNPDAEKVLSSANPIGQTFTELGYTSTTLSKDKAFQFLDKGERLFVIDAPKGTKAGIITNEIGAFGDLEKEVLLGRGNIYKITAVDRIKENYHYRGFMGEIKSGKRTVEYIHLTIVNEQKKETEKSIVKTFFKYIHT
jgi:hypothetical protein